MKRFQLITVLLSCMAGAALAEDGAAERFIEYKSSPPLLRAFLYRMPKGGDLHSHLSGAAYAEANIRAGADANLCVDPTTTQVSKRPCIKPILPLADALTDINLRKTIVNAWSMLDFVPGDGNSGHDHFFGTFSLFGGAAQAGDMAAEVVDRAGRQRMRYVELMVTFQGQAINTVADNAQKAKPWTGDPAAFEATLTRLGLMDLVPKAKADLDGVEQRMRTVLGCGTVAARPGCGVTVRWLHQVSRTAPRHRVFTSALLGALLNRADPRAVGLNFVQPEDHPAALADYTVQMQLLDYINGRVPEANITLHAGELTLGLVPPEHLLFHIRLAVELGHAKRIGHGVDVMYEDDPFDLLRTMAARRVAVEINLTSNAQILGVEGAAHPFQTYRAAGVPVLLCTDDEGIARIDRTHELQRAVTTYDLDWPSLVALERNTLEYAFVAGGSLWADARAWRMVADCADASPSNEPPSDCAAYLAANEKARLQWTFERDLLAFDEEARGPRLRLR